MKKRARSFVAAAAVAVVFLAGLGVWQLQRRAEKMTIIAQAELALAQPPQALPPSSQWAETDFKRLEYQKVALEGRYRPYREFHLYAVIPQASGRFGGAGWYVVSPFDLGNGGTVFVNRGFVPANKRDPAERPESLAGSETQTLIGMVRLPEHKTPFTPENDLHTNQWYLRDPAAFAAFGKIDNSAPLIVDQISENKSPLPQPGDGRMFIANNHLQYALTWFALAITALVFGAIFYLKKN